MGVGTAAVAIANLDSVLARGNRITGGVLIGQIFGQCLHRFSSGITVELNNQVIPIIAVAQDAAYNGATIRHTAAAHPDLAVGVTLVADTQLFL